MSEPTPALCELLPWDTEFFGCRIARVCGDTLKPEQSAQVEEWCRGSRIRCLYFLSRTDDPATIQAAEQQGFGLMDIRVTFEQSVMNSRDAIPPALPADASIRPTQPDDLPALQAMAQAGHTDTRFFSDPRFPRQRAEDLYSTWITLESQARAQKALVVASTVNKPLGYVTCHLYSDRQGGQIALFGVS